MAPSDEAAARGAKTVANVSGVTVGTLGETLRGRRSRAAVPAVTFLALIVTTAAGLDPRDIRQSLFAACVLDGRESWIVGELGRVLHTTDGLRTLRRLDVGTRSAFTSIACPNEKTVYLVGPRGLARRSRDGGASWEELNTGTKQNLLSVAFATPDIGIAVGDYGTIVRTDDGGRTWQTMDIPSHVPLPEEIAQTIEPSDVLLYDVAFASPEQAWIVGEFGVIFSTVDGGRTWTAEESPVPTTLFGVDFADVLHGWVVGMESVMLATADGGKTWHTQDIPVPSAFSLSLYDVDVDGQWGWAVGESGLLLHSDDGGRSWKRAELPIVLAGHWFRGVSVAPSGLGLVVGSDGLILPIARNEVVLRGQPH